jgi:penicillin-binding protein 2
MPWFPGNTVMMSIGQGYLLATPLQLAQLAAAVANGGDIYRPHLLKRITDGAGATLEEPQPQLARHVPCASDTLRAIRRGMTDAVNAPGGTAWRARVAGVDVAGKTGTAQNPHGEDHADFISYAPAEAPRLAVAVVVENGGEGGLTAAPIAKRLYEVYFGK